MLIAHVLRLLGCSRGPRKPDVETRLAGIGWPTLSWTFLTSWAGGERREISPGFDLGRDDWRPIVDPDTGRQRKIEARDPLHGIRRCLGIWYLSHGDDIWIFAADEVSNGVWIVFVPEGAAHDELYRSGPRQ